MIISKDEIAITNLAMAAGLLEAGAEIARPAQIFKTDRGQTLTIYLKDNGKTHELLEDFNAAGDTPLGFLNRVLTARKQILTDCYQAENVTVFKSNGKTAYLSDKLTTAQKENLLKKM